MHTCTEPRGTHVPGPESTCTEPLDKRVLNPGHTCTETRGHTCTGPGAHVYGNRDACVRNPGDTCVPGMGRTCMETRDARARHRGTRARNGVTRERKPGRTCTGPGGHVYGTPGGTCVRKPGQDGTRGSCERKPGRKCTETRGSTRVRNGGHVYGNRSAIVDWRADPLENRSVAANTPPANPSPHLRAMSVRGSASAAARQRKVTAQVKVFMW